MVLCGIEGGKPMNTIHTIGSSDFKIVCRSDYYVDKTRMLVPLLSRCQSGTSIMFNRPRRFGKSLAMSMIETFFSDEVDNASSYFNGLAISHYDISSYISKYKVIRISLADIGEEEGFDALEYLKRKIAESYRRFDDLLDSSLLSDYEKKNYQAILNVDASETSFALALKELSGYLYRVYNTKPIFLIDEYDAVYEKQGNDQHAIAFLKNILTALLKDNDSLGMGILTGVFSLARGSLGSGLNNVPVDNGLSIVLDDNYFGFTEDEVIDLLKRYGRDPSSIASLKDYYGGYLYNKQEYLNPWSIVNYLNSGLLLGYWIDSARGEAMGALMDRLDEDGREAINRLMEGDTITRSLDFALSYENLFFSADNIMLYLAMAGYLSIAQDGISTFNLRITNKETLSAFQRLYADYYLDQNGLATARLFRQAIQSGDGDGLGKLLERFMLSALSYYDFSDEKNYQIMVGALASVILDDCFVRHEVLSGQGRCDIMISPRLGHGFGAIIELKHFKDRRSYDRLQANAAAALRQIKSKGYDGVLHQMNVSPIYAYGIAFYKNRVAVKAEKIG